VSLAALQTSPIAGAASPSVIAVMLLYGVIVGGIAVWASRRTRSAKDFFVAGKGIGIWTLGIAAMSATLSGFAFIGGPGLVYTMGLGAMFIILPASLTNSMGAWVLAKRMRLLGEARGLITIPDAIGARYRSPAAQGLSGLAILVAIIGYMATNVLALGLVVDAIFGTGLSWGIWIGLGVVLAYSAAGGILAGVYTDLFQGAVMALASVLVFWYALGAGGGLSGISRTILAAEPGFLGPWGSLSPLAALSFFFVFGLGALGQPHVLHKFYMLRDPLRLKWYPAIMTGALMLTLLLYFGVGVAIKAEVIAGSLAPLARADDATPRFLLSYTPALLAGLVFAGVAAAIMSTVNSFLNVGAAVVTHDLPLALGRAPSNQLIRGRVSTVAIGVISALVAQLSGTLVAFLGIFGWGLFASTLVPALAIGLNWPGATRSGAIASIATGLVATLGLETAAYFRLLTFPGGVTVSGLALALSLLVFLGVSRLTRAEADDLDPDIRLVMET
jgi:Na+/proline symporter